MSLNGVIIGSRSKLIMRLVRSALLYNGCLQNRQQAKVILTSFRNVRPFIAGQWFHARIPLQ